ncbi:hypothetical protein HOLleu_01024 [Holothuria leucospilota]|uniref:Uncharacterized protein n=1 Tax=Holothuria leucospilota TaxID=206669 RepID=A0A9Q1CPW6_HOLLE|nr:hypothetical protein HOLleu_01024 [Holothuria leucospilota]
MSGHFDRYKVDKTACNTVPTIKLKENEVDMVVGSLGHDLKIHREYYRLPPMEIMRVANVPKVLFALQEGTISHGMES